MIYRVMAELGSMSPGPTLYGPALQSVTQSWVDAVWSSSLGSGPTLCGPVVLWVAQSWVDAVWSSSLWSGLKVVVYLVIV